MRRHHRQHIIVIERVAVGAVDQRGGFGRRGAPGAEDRRGTGFVQAFKIFLQRLGDFRAYAGEDHGIGIGDDLDGFFIAACGEVFCPSVDNKIRDGGCGAHDVPSMMW